MFIWFCFCLFVLGPTYVYSPTKVAIFEKCRVLEPNKEAVRALPTAPMPPARRCQRIRLGRRRLGRTLSTLPLLVRVQTLMLCLLMGALGAESSMLLLHLLRRAGKRGAATRARAKVKAAAKQDEQPSDAEDEANDAAHFPVIFQSFSSHFPVIFQS